MKSRILSALAIVAVFCCGIADGQVPRKLNYQGFITTPSGAPVNSAGLQMVFNIYNVQTLGSPLHTETQTVTVSNGIFNVLLGTSTALTLPFDAQYYLGVTPGVDPEMSPRQPLAASPYAIRAASAEAATTAASATTAGNASNLGGVPAAGWQRALSTPACVSGFLTVLNADGSSVCGSPGTAQDNTFAIVNAVDAAKTLRFNLSSAASATATTLAAQQSTNRILTLPDATDMLVGRSTTDTLTNKTINSVTNIVTADNLRSATGQVSISAATPPTSGQVLTATGTTSATWQTPTAIPLQSGLQFRFTQANGNGFEVASNLWLRAGVFVYRGTSVEKVPTSFITLLYTTNTSSYARIRIQDVTNAQTIATGAVSNTGTNSLPVVVDLGTISNLPAVPSIFEIQILSTDNTGVTGVAGRQAVGIHSLQMY